MKQKTKVLALLLAATMVAGAALTGCGTGDSNNSNSNSNTDNNSAAQGDAAKEDFTIAWASDLKSMDPHATNDSTSSTIQYHIYSTLLAVDEEGNIVGDLAENWEASEDELTWTFKLKQGVKFHNGEELKASDVKFSLDREKEGARTAYLVEKVDNIEVIDDYTVAVHLSQKDGSLLYSLAQAGSSILNEKAVNEKGDKYADSPVGTGPMKLVEWVPNDHITLERFDDYYAGAAKAKTITWRTIPEGSSRAIALENGEVDLVTGIDPIDVARTMENANLKTELIASTGCEYLGFNFEKEPFNDVRVRQAFAYAINKQNIVDVVFEGRGEIANSVVGSAIPGYDATVPGYEYNPEKAKELLAEAGFPNGFKTTIKTSGDIRNRQAQLIQADLAAIGVEAEIELLDWGAYLEAINAGDMETYIISWSNSTMDVSESLVPLFHSKNWGPTGNRMHYSNPEVDALLDELVATSDKEARYEIGAKVQHIVGEEAPWATLVCKYSCMGYQKDLKGVKIMPNENHRYENMYY